MRDEFAPLLAFYERCGPDAIGHGVVAIAGHEAELLEKFIGGTCNASERRQLAQVLQSHPHLIRHIAERIKMNRNPSEDSTGASSQ